MFLFTLARSSIHLNGISNALAGSSERSRFLGMVVGTAMSKVIDEKDKRMNFGLEEVESPEGKWYQELIQVQDSVGDMGILKQDAIVKMPRKSESHRPLSGTRPAGSKIIAIQEIEDSSDEDSDDFVSYEKPDSDEEDEDEDPTLIQRNKPTAPV
jgi:telomere length regulation protein